MPEGEDPVVIQFIKILSFLIFCLPNCKKRLKRLNIFWKNGGSIVFFSGNQPFTFQTFQTNLFLEQMVLPNGDNVSVRIRGNHPGEQILEVDDSRLLEKIKIFNTKVLPSSRYERKAFVNNLYQIWMNIL